MNDSYFLALASACWLGILTSISPCPMASNIAAITYIGKRIDRPGYVIITGLLYTLGRALTYVVVGMLIIASTLAIPDVSFFLQQHINKFIGPVLLIVGLFLVGAIKFKVKGPGFGDKMQRRVDKMGLWGAGFLGILFALSFCPVSAALYFGGLIPMAVDHQSNIMMPTVFGVGTALPVVGFAIFIALGTRYVGSAFKKLSIFEKWARKITGVIFILVGIYFVLAYILGINLF